MPVLGWVRALNPSFGGARYALVRSIEAFILCDRLWKGGAEAAMNSNRWKVYGRGYV
jgi:hypothetical protein